MWRKITIVRHM